MKMKFLWAGAAALALAACGGEADEADVAAEDTAAEDTAADAADPAMPTPAQGFADMQAASDKFEIESSRLAGGKASSQEVKDFAAMMIRDHTKSSEDLKAAAGAAGVSVNPDPALPPALQAHLDELRRDGTNFDGAYKRQQLSAHQETLRMLRNYAENGDNPALKDFAGKTATVVEGHLEHARELP